MIPKKALFIEDLSCFGKCALSLALPAASAAGVVTSVLPTAVLSTHTGGFGTPVKADLTAFLTDTFAHYDRENIRFDGVCCGYCVNQEQVDFLAENGRKLLLPGGIFLVDPVMGDNGKLFTGLDKSFVPAMLRLCEKADAIVPNLTEACLLCQEEYPVRPDVDFAARLGKRLAQKTQTTVVLTGAGISKGKITTLICDTHGVTQIFSPVYSVAFHGAGDLFTAVFAAQLVLTKDFNRAAQTASDFVSESIALTQENAFPEREGILFEPLLSRLKAEEKEKE